MRHAAPGRGLGCLLKVALIGGQKEVPGADTAVLAEIQPGDVVYTPRTRGMEERICRLLEEEGIVVRKVDPRPTWYTNPNEMAALEACQQVEKIVVVGSGGKQKLALAWWRRVEGWRDKPSIQLVEIRA